MKWKVLAGLRFFLALIVVSYHLKDFVPNYGKDLLCQLGKFNGMAAVLGFLLVSGYSIAHSITKNTKGFYQRRILRIYPLYVCAVLVSLIPFLILGSKVEVFFGVVSQPELWTVIGNLMFWQTFVVDTLQSNNPLWTLAVEVFCYLLAPVFVKLSNKVLAVFIGLSAIFYGAYPYVYGKFFPDSSLPVYSAWKFGIPFCFFLWAWLSGFLYYRLSQNKKGFLKGLILGLGVLLLAINHNHLGKLGIVTYLLSCVVLVISSNVQIPKLMFKFFDYLGDISYPLYLFHMPAFIFLSGTLKIKSSPILFLFALFISILFYHIIDVPLRLKKPTGQPNLT